MQEEEVDNDNGNDDDDDEEEKKRSCLFAEPSSLVAADVKKKFLLCLLFLHFHTVRKCNFTKGSFNTSPGYSEFDTILQERRRDIDVVFNQVY